eukprot:COSAG06_NODE_1869_length_8172_cov_3.579143_12_plen_89_part_00
MFVPSLSWQNDRVYYVQNGIAKSTVFFLHISTLKSLFCFIGLLPPNQSMASNTSAYKMQRQKRSDCARFFHVCPKLVLVKAAVVERSS